MKNRRAPFSYFGGKQRMARHLLPFCAVDHVAYVEPFCGAASLLFAKDRATVEVLNDLDGLLINCFRVLQDDGAAKLLADKMQKTPYARAEYAAACCRSTCPFSSDIDRAAAFLITAQMGFSGHPHGGFATAVSTKPGRLNRWQTMQKLEPVTTRLKNVQIENVSFEKIFSKYDREKTLFYCDPPYVPTARREGRYWQEMTIAAHESFLSVAVAARGFVIISGYQCELYERKLTAGAGWKRFDFPRKAHSLQRGAGAYNDAKHDRVESVWINPKLAAALEKQSLQT